MNAILVITGYNMIVYHLVFYVEEYRDYQSQYVFNNSDTKFLKLNKSLNIQAHLGSKFVILKAS